MSHFLKESCVESLSEAISAEKNGANLIELCSNLNEDGLTPSIELIRSVQKNVNIPIKVMIRPRKGNFDYNIDDINIIRKHVQIANDLGIKQIVFGATKDSSLDMDLIQKVSNWAEGMDITIHKAIDTVLFPLKDIEKLKRIRYVNSILTSGQSKTAFDGVEMLKSMKRVASNALTVIPAGKITEENVDALHNILKLKHYHGRKIVRLS